VRNFFALARDDAVIDEVCDALAGDVLVACIGDVTAAEVRGHGLNACHPAQPVLGMLVPTIANALRADRHHHLRTGGGRQVIVQHRLVHTTTASVVTSDREAALLGELLSSRAVTRERLLRSVWRGEDVDPSVVETTVARLRRRLASTGVSVTTINGRGYMLDAERVPCV